MARDQVGLQPLFVARSEGRWHFAGAPRALVSLPGVSRAIDAVALSEWICGWYPAIEDTAYREVKRVPPATVTTFDRGEVVQRRYWDPSPITEPIAWSREEDLEAFEGLLTRAVTRAVGGERRTRDIPQRRGRFDHDRGGGNRHQAGGGASSAPGAVAGVSGRRQQRGGRPDRSGPAIGVAAAARPARRGVGQQGAAGRRAGAERQLAAADVEHLVAGLHAPCAGGGRRRGAAWS